MQKRRGGRNIEFVKSCNRRNQRRKILIAKHSQPNGIIFILIPFKSHIQKIIQENSNNRSDCEPDEIFIAKSYKTEIVRLNVEVN